MLDPKGSQVPSVALVASGAMVILAHEALPARQEPKAQWGVWEMLVRLDTVVVLAKQEKLVPRVPRETTSSMKLMVPTSLRSVLVGRKE